MRSDASKREMQQPYWTVARADEGYGLGFSLRQIGDRRVVGHGGAFPGHATRTLFDPRDRLAVVVLTNAIDGPAADLGRTVMALLDFALRQPPAAPGREADARARFAGRFINLWRVTDVVALGETLVAIDPDDPEPVKNATQLDVEDESTLRITASNGYSAPGEAVRYERDGAGNVARIVAGGLSSYPLETYRRGRFGA
jgi:CubicO group peptidase (beta-lactamase class C family)